MTLGILSYSFLWLNYRADKPLMYLMSKAHWSRPKKTWRKSREQKGYIYMGYSRLSYAGLSPAAPAAALNMAIWGHTWPSTGICSDALWEKINVTTSSSTHQEGAVFYCTWNTTLGFSGCVSNRSVRWAKRDPTLRQASRNECQACLIQDSLLQLLHWKDALWEVN